MIFDWKDGLIWVSVGLKYEGFEYIIDQCRQRHLSPMMSG